MDAPAPTPPPDTPPPAPLLPEFFLKPRAVLWLWALPAALLLLLNLQAYELIEGNMDAAQHHHAQLLGLAGLGNVLAALGFYGFSRWRPLRPSATLPTHFLHGMVPLSVQTAYLWLALSRTDEVLPRSVTAWIYPEERFVFGQLTFAMLPLFLGILRLACGYPVRNTGKSIAFSLGLGIGAPIALYVLGLSVFDTRFIAPIAGYVVAVSIVTCGILMFVGIIRFTMLVVRRGQAWGAVAERAAIVLFALALPVGGLLLNRLIPFPVDFQAWEVYALTLANAGGLLLASWHHARRPRLSFLLLCATFPFSFYFFFVFLPYTPLSILAVVVFGFGFLVLAPTFLFVLHLSLLNKSLRAHAGTARPLRLGLAGALCALLLPGVFVVRSLADRAALHAALDYVYAPTIDSGERRYPASRLNLRRALASHRSYKNGIYYPILSDAYAWLVFDHLVLPDDKLASLETTFFGEAGATENDDLLRSSRNPFGRSHRNRNRHRAPRNVYVPRTVGVSGLEVRTTPVDAGTTTATLVLTLAHNGTDTFGPAEFVRTLQLPAGVFVNGFRLHINGTPVPGRIVERKTATWVYNMIRDAERRDPGLLRYTSPTELELRVFPVDAGKPVVVEFDLLVPGHLADADFAAPGVDPDQVLARIGDLLQPRLAPNPSDVVATGLEGLHLHGTVREPYAHIIVDRSADNAFEGDLAAAAKDLRRRFPGIRRARVSVANHDAADLVPSLTPLGQLPALGAKDWERQLPAAGGLSLDIALARALRRHRDDDLDRGTDGIPPRPVFVILGRTAKPRTLNLPLAEAWADAGEELEIHEIGADGSHCPQRESAGDALPLLRLGTSIRPLAANRPARFAVRPGRANLEYYDAQDAVWRPVSSGLQPAAAGPWTEAVALQLRQQDHTRSPGTPGNDLPALVAASRASGILIPDTSYIVVENSAQWKMLEKGEKQKLGQNAALEFVETPAPPALWVALGFGGWLALRRRRHSGAH